MRERFLLAVAVLATAPAVAATPGPDPRLEQALNANVVAPIERSVDLSKTVPPPERARKPAVDPAMVRVREDVYVDPRLVPPRPDAADGEPAIRVYRRDRR